KTLENANENGCIALRDGGRGEQGVADVRVGVRPGPCGDGGGVATPGCARGSDQLRGCVALAVRGACGGRLGEVGGQSRSRRPLRAACEEAPAQAISINDKTAIRIT